MILFGNVHIVRYSCFTICGYNSQYEYKALVDLKTGVCIFCISISGETITMQIPCEQAC